MDDQELRLKCLEMSRPDPSSVSVCRVNLTEAQKIYDFATGTNDSEVIAAARALAETLKLRG